MFSFSKGFARARKNTGLTQAGFAEKYHYEPATIKNWEQGRTVPEASTLESLCEIFNCDLSYLFYQIDETTHDLQYICKRTGLSEDAIQKIIEFAMSPRADVLEYLLQAPSFSLFLYALHAISSGLDEAEEKINVPCLIDELSHYHNGIRLDRLSFDEMCNNLLNEYCGYSDRMKKIADTLLRAGESPFSFAMTDAMEHDQCVSKIFVEFLKADNSTLSRTLLQDPRRYRTMKKLHENMPLEE